MIVQFANAVKYFNNVILNELSNSGITCWIGGGSVRDYFMGIPMVTDYDLFFPDSDNFNKAKKYLIKNKGAIIWESDNGCKIKYKNRTFDLVKKTFYKSPQEAIESFDFTVSMFAVDMKNVYYGETSFIDLAKRQLIINKITYPASTLSRAFRYYTKGFRMCAVEIKKLYEAIQQASQQTEDNVIAKAENVSSADLMNFFSGID